MNNKEIYSKTIGFSLRRLLWDFMAFLVLAALGGIGFLVADKVTDKGLIGLGIGTVVGIVVLVVWLRYISYTYKAGQIAMMTRAITEGSLPDDVIAEGKRTVKDRFATVAAFFAVTGVIKGIFNQIGKAITDIGQSAGGDQGGTVGSIISTVLQTIVAYLCDCCLGWVFYRKEVKTARATCEGAVLFFKHGKTFAKNMGRVFGMGLVSLLLIGGSFTGFFYTIFSRFPEAFQNLHAEVMEAAARAGKDIPQILSDPALFTLICALFAGVILWGILHSVFVRPFILVGVLRNFLVSGMNNIPTENSFAMLDAKSAKFKKLHGELA